MTVTRRPSYTVTVSRQDDRWFAEVDGLPPNMLGATDVPWFGDLDPEVRDLVAGLTQTEPDSFGLTWVFTPAP